MMRIKQISVNGLFGIFDHVIPLNLDERITIIHGPNGFGKTAILRLLNGFFNSRYSELKNIPFESFKIEFDNDSHVEIIKGYNVNFNFYSEDFRHYTFDINKIEISPVEPFPISILDNLPGLERVASREWIYSYTKEILSLEKVLEKFSHLFPSQLEFQNEPDWLHELRKNIDIRFIESQRLLNFVPNRSPISYRGTPSMLSTVSAYTDDLAKLMQDKFKEYGTISQSLDRTFPVRVVRQQPSQDLTDEQLREQLNELEKTRSGLIEVGLLDRDENPEFQIQPQDIDESTKNALSVYVEDVEKKLSVFKEIASKLELLRKIINQKFSYSYKEIKFSKEKGFGFKTHYNSSPNSNSLSPTDLSSGEQHELVLIYELLFKVKPDSLVLIDEPELSLHVGWQVQFLKDLQEITKLADLDILMATHSPDIIQDRWDLTVELKGSEK